MFRSEQMSLVQMLIQPEVAFHSMAELGALGTAQFRDFNTNINVFQRRFSGDIRRCDEMERIIGYIRRQLLMDKISLQEAPPYNVKLPDPREIIDLEVLLEKTESEIRELAENWQAILENCTELVELRNVLEKIQIFFGDGSISRSAFEDIGDDSSDDGGPLEFVAGVIPRERIAGFEQMLWRVSLGNTVVRQAPIEEPFVDPVSRNKMHKIAFVAFFQGEQLRNRIKKVCSGFHATLYSVENGFEERVQMLKEVSIRTENFNTIINRTKDQRQMVLLDVAQKIPTWDVYIRNIKAIYYTLNKFSVDVSSNFLFAEAWVPTMNLQDVNDALIRTSRSLGSTTASYLYVVENDEDPPTYHRTNKFTVGFQNLIDSYGVASYRECNPALYTVVTFPFLFAIMFGDLGHGIILSLFALWMVLYENKLSEINDEIWKLFFGGRYTILLMGCFSIYTGFVYNDLFSKTINLFGSAWSIHYNTSTVMTNDMLQLNPGEDYSTTIYQFGLDPAWMLALNKIIFQNSFKMKLSIIFGVAHMLLGVCLSAINHKHFRKSVDILLEWLPQLLFLILLFGYLCFLMFFKWIKYTAVTDEESLKPGCTPSVLVMFIGMMLFKEQKPLDGCKEFMFNGQDIVQIVILTCSLMCIPWLMLAKPCYIFFRRKQTGVPSEQEPMSEIFIHQAIHTVEYVLGTVSHTASYLRLWALSLAHSQLSEVLYNRVFRVGFLIPNYVGAVAIWALFLPWSGLTVGLLVVIEGLSAFLHTLRLHWVEFMSKFYQGEGHPFKPFSFKAIMEEEQY
ncbi:V-type proton ATPase 116 kDa subunit a 1-like [Sabethes cyaneus]|uniref:V-type proton ATPase 116 kDa subunit a 1-like n=1 Tax=Sabethes cyaneus TaxID=53552 RepID=UPI00237E48DE|nr:V-type proton ATPase 116 kDa subunit a 1-like [Sabethes cyaneus]